MQQKQKEIGAARVNNGAAVTRQPRAPGSITASDGSVLDTRDWWLYRDENKRTRYDWGGKAEGWLDSPIMSANRKKLGIAVAIRELGRGSERIVYDLRQFEQLLPGSDVVQLQKESLVAKESLYAEDDAHRNNFHYLFCKTQQQAAYLSHSFNNKVGMLFAQRKWIVPATITFLSCYVYELHGSSPDTPRFLNVLVEKKLDSQKWTKWNSNDGRVFGFPGAIKTGDDRNLDENAAAVSFNMHAVISDGSDSEEEDTDQKMSKAKQERSTMMQQNAGRMQQSAITSSDFPQVCHCYIYRIYIINFQSPLSF